MDILLSSGLTLTSLVMLFYGAEFVLHAGEKIGLKFGMSKLTIGMLIIGFGTSLPEFFVSHIAAYEEIAPMAIGSLLGSNIANLLLVLGLCALFTKLSLSSSSIKEQAVVHLILGLVLLFVLSQSELSFVNIIPLITLSVIYLFYVYKDLVREKAGKELLAETIGDDALNSEVKFFDYFKLVSGFVLLFFGGDFLVQSATKICLEFGIDEYILSAILVAFGTSFPELVTSLMSVVRKKGSDLIVGNIIGSNLFNCAFILSSLGIYDFKFDRSFDVELQVLITGSVILVLLSLMNRGLNKFFGVLYLMLYAYIVFKWTGG